MKSVVCDEIEKNKDKLISVAKEILENPEPGFKEFKTSKIVSREFSSLDMSYESGIAITGLKSNLDSGKPGRNIAVIGELDSVKVLGHPFGDQETTAAHACGHHCQIAMMLGVAVGLKASGVLESLSGKVTFMAVPAEEYIEIEYILTEKLSVFNEKNIYIKDLFGGKDYNAVMVAAKIRGVRLIDNLIFS